MRTIAVGVQALGTRLFRQSTQMPKASLRPLVALRPCAPMQCDDRCVTADYRYHALTPQTDHALMIA